jgi:hypothetical protein
MHVPNLLKSKVDVGKERARGEEGSRGEGGSRGEVVRGRRAARGKGGVARSSTRLHWKNKVLPTRRLTVREVAFEAARCKCCLGGVQSGNRWRVQSQHAPASLFNGIIPTARGVGGG